MIRTEIYITKFMLNSSKTKQSIQPQLLSLALLYPFFVRVFGLSSFVTGDFEEDKWTLAEVTAPIIYQKIYGISDIEKANPLPYSYIALLRFLSHMCLDKSEYSTVNFYKSEKALFLVDEIDIILSDSILFDTPILKINSYHYTYL